MDVLILLPADPLRALAAADLAKALGDLGFPVLLMPTGAALPDGTDRPCLIVLDDGQALRPLARRFPAAQFLRLIGPLPRLGAQSGRLFHRCRDLTVLPPTARPARARRALVPAGLAVGTSPQAWLQSMPRDVPTLLVCPSGPAIVSRCWKALNGASVLQANQIWCPPPESAAGPVPRSLWSHLYFKPGFDPAHAIGIADLAIVEGDAALALRLLASGLPVLLVDGDPAYSRVIGRGRAGRAVPAAQLGQALKGMLAEGAKLRAAAESARALAQVRSAPAFLAGWSDLAFLSPAVPLYG